MKKVYLFVEGLKPLDISMLSVEKCAQLVSEYEKSGLNYYFKVVNESGVI